MNLQEIKEGETKLKIPNREKYLSPEEAPVFYNPKMEKDRDLSVEVVKKFFSDKEKEELKALDALSATGARAIRYSKEVGINSIANDADPESVKIIEKNISINQEIEVEKRNEDANRLMTGKENFDFIDIDPFGSPAPFLDSAFKALKPKKSLLAVTATDLGALSGHYPKTCFRRYGIRCKENPWEHETGLRNLILAVQKIGAVNQFTVTPILCYWRQHYYRCFFEIRESKKGVNRKLKEAGYIGYCNNCGKRKYINLFEDIETECNCGSRLDIIGPTWLGYLGDEEFLDKLEMADPLLSRIKEESRIKNLHYDTHRISKLKEGKARKKSNYIDRLREKGYKAQETIFIGHGFRTNAPQKRIFEIDKE